MSDDGCGGILACGDPAWAGNCPPGSVCSFNKTCVEPPDVCVPKPKCLYKECGFEDDGCQGQIPCGTPDGSCPNPSDDCLYDGLTCTPSCVPATTCLDAFKCGVQPNGCGSNILCGECNDGYFCDSSSGTSSSCKPVIVSPCVPKKTKCDGGQVCGSQVDDCGQIIQCGDCPYGEVIEKREEERGGGG